MASFQEYQPPTDDPSATSLGQTAEKRKKASVKSRISNFFNPKPAEVDAKYKHGKHSIKDNVVTVTERNAIGRLKQKLTGKEELRPPEYGRVFPAAVEWWTNHATELMNFWPNGPGEHHPFYDQWQMARTFVHTDGRVKSSLVAKAFEEDHDFYEKTMFFKRYNAIMLKNALGIEKVIRHHKAGMIKQGQQPLGDEILVPELAQGGGPVMEKIIPSLLEAEASAVAALATISLALTVAGGSVVLPPAVLATVSAYAVAAGITLVGGTGSYLLGRDSFVRIVRAAKQRGELNNLITVCDQALKVIQSQSGDCDFMRVKFGIDPREIVAVGGKLHFNEGSTSTGWASAQETIIQEEKFREWYLKDLVRLDNRALHGSHRRFRKVHLYEDQFLTEKGGKLVISQSGSAYERDWANRFEAMRQARNVGGSLDLVPANRERLQLLYMEAGKSICVEVADERFSTKVLPDILKQDNEKIMKSATKEVKKKIDALRKGETPDKDGQERVKLKKGAQASFERAGDLKTGLVAKEGEPAKAGLVQAKEKIRGTKSETPGLYDRKEGTDKLYGDIYESALKFPKFYTKVVEVRERKSIKSIEALMLEIQQEISDIAKQSPGGLLYQLEIQRTKLNTAHVNRLATITNDLVNYSGKDGEGKRNKDLKNQQDIFDKEDARITTQKEEIKTKLGELQALLVQLQEKQNALIKQYQALEYTATERTDVAGLAELMKLSYTKLKAAIPQARLVAYGTPGNLMSDFMSTIVAAGGIWTPPEDEQYENQLTVLYAVAEARAKAQNKDLHKKPMGLHAQFLSKTGGKLSPEQLITMSPHEVYDRVHASISPPWTPPPPYVITHLQEISQAASVENARYEAREKGLQSVMDTQDLVITRMQKEVKTVDDTCDARIEQLVLLESVIQDRAVIYCEAPNMVRTESLRAYADGTLVQASSMVHSTMEVNHPVGFVKFMQDVFAYHTFTDEGRDGKGTQRSDLDLLKKNSRDNLFDSLLRSLGTPPELMLANLIVEGYGEGDFQSLLEGGILAKNLTFDQVMSVITYRHDCTFPRPMIGVIPIAQLRTADYPVKPGEMKRMLESIVVELTKKAMAGKI